MKTPPLYVVLDDEARDVLNDLAEQSGKKVTEVASDVLNEFAKLKDAPKYVEWAALGKSEGLMEPEPVAAEAAPADVETSHDPDFIASLTPEQRERLNPGLASFQVNTLTPTEAAPEA